MSNVAPELADLVATSIDEDGVTTLTGTITDPGTLDTFTLDVNWGDALSPDNLETYSFAASTTTFELTHQYLDDNPTKTTSDSYTISVTATSCRNSNELGHVHAAASAQPHHQIKFIPADPLV